MGTCLDLGEWLHFLASVVFMKSQAEKLIEATTGGYKKTLEDYWELQNLFACLEINIHKFDNLIFVMNLGGIPGTIKDGEALLTFPEDVESTISMLRKNEAFKEQIASELLDNFEGSLNNLALQVHKITNDVYPFAKQFYNTLMELGRTLKEIDDEYADLIADAYYDFLEERMYDVEDRLASMLYSEDIIKDFAKDPTSSDWALLLRKKLTDAHYEKPGKFISRNFSHLHTLNIKDDKYVKYMFTNCTDIASALLFFNYFLEFAVLQSKAKGFTIQTRPIEDAGLTPLPKEVAVSIRENAQCHRLFVDAINKLIPITGKSAYKTKWSHVKKFLEDEELIDKDLNDTEFGRVMHKINSDIDEENCRANVKNNSLSEKTKYYDLAETDATRTICEKIAEHFQELFKIIPSKARG